MEAQAVKFEPPRIPAPSKLEAVASSESSIPQNINEESYTREQVVKALAYVHYMQDVANLRGLEQIKPEISESDSIPSSVIYETTNALGIPRELVEKALALTKSPTAAQKKKDREYVGAREILALVEKRYVKGLLETLKAEDPIHNKDYILKEDVYYEGRKIRTFNFYKLGEKPRGFLGFFKKRPKIELAELNSQGYHSDIQRLKLDIEIKDPLFLRLCKEKIKQLQSDPEVDQLKIRCAYSTEE